MLRPCEDQCAGKVGERTHPEAGRQLCAHGPLSTWGACWTYGPYEFFNHQRATLHGAGVSLKDVMSSQGLHLQ